MTDKQASVRARKMLDHYESAIRERNSPFPYAAMLGMDLVAVEPGKAVVELAASRDHQNPIGTVHGGVLCSVADTAMGIAHATLLEEGEISTTVDLNINFLRPVSEGRLRAEGRIVKHGKTLSLVECDLLDAEGKLVARGSSTCMTLRTEQ